MSDHHEPETAETGDEVEAHGLKEAAVTGLSAAALIAGAGDAIAATTPGHAAVTAKQAVHKIDAHKDAAWKGSAVSKLSTDPTLKRATDPTLKRATDPTLKRSGPGAT